MIFFFIRKREIKHSSSCGCFYFEIEREKDILLQQILLLIDITYIFEYFKGDLWLRQLD